MHEVAQALLAWYEQTKRSLPWRETKDPYRIWVSEIMLQQTRVETVIPYYQRFMQRFPDLAALSVASQDEVVKYWEGLGYYSRVRRLHDAVKEVEAEYGGVVPNDQETFRSLPGVGDYTAGAVMSIAYDVDAIAVDGNVLRVFSRLFAVNKEITSQAAKKQIAAHVQDVLPSGQAGAFNQAIMDLGSAGCVRAKPRCSSCPLTAFCHAYAQDSAARFPVKKPKKTIPTHVFYVYLLQNENKIAVRQRPQEGLLAGLWELPYTSVPNKVENDDFFTDSDQAKATLGAVFPHLNVHAIDYSGQFDHVFSHLKWQMHLFRAHVSETSKSESLQFVSPQERNQLTFGTIFTKMMKRYL